MTSIPPADTEFDALQRKLVPLWRSINHINADAQTIKRTAQLEGMDTLRDDGARKVLLGKTTVEEVIAATKDDVVVDS